MPYLYTTRGRIRLVLAISLLLAIIHNGYSASAETIVSASVTMPPIPEDCNNALVGKSVIIDDVNAGTISLLVGINSLANIVDGDLENFAEFGGLDATVLGSALVSVKNTGESYPAGRRAGFLIENSGGLLAANLISGLEVRTYLNGTLQESASVSGGNILSLDLLGGSSGPQRLSFLTTLPFDEIELAQSGLLTLGGNIRVYYAFEEDPNCDADCTDEIVPSNGYNPGIIGARTGSSGLLCVFCGVSNTSEAIDNTLSNGAILDFGISVGSVLALSIDMDSTLAAGSQAGFVVTRSGLLDLTLLGGFTIETYNNGFMEDQQLLNSGLATVGLLNGGSQTSIAITTTAAFDEIRLIANSGLLGIGSTITVNYGFVRRDTDGDGVVDCIDKCDGDDNLLNINGLPLDCNPECPVDAGSDFAICSAGNAGATAQLVMAPGGTGYTYTVLPGNPSPAAVDGSGQVTGFSVEGLYFFSVSDGTCADTVAVNYSTGNTMLACNDPIVGNDVVVDAAGAFQGVCLLCTDGDAANVVDADLSNALVYTELLSLLTLESLISVKDTANVYVAGSRAGYVVEFPNGLLSLSLLSTLQLRTYLDDNLQETALGSTLLDVDLLGGTGNRQKVAFTTTLPYDEIELLAGNGVSLLGEIAIYYAFTEDIGCGTGSNPLVDPESVCIEPLTTGSSYCASINYDATGFDNLLCVGCSLSPLSALLDNDLTTGTTLTQTVGVGTSSTVAVRTATTVSPGYEAGFVVGSSSALLDVGVLANLTLSTYLNGVLQEAVPLSSSLASVSLLNGGNEATAISFRSGSAFDEVRLTTNGLVGADLLGSGLIIYYAYVRLDSDGDGVPDCLDRCCLGDDMLDSDGNGVPDGCDNAPTAVNDGYTVIVGQSTDLPVLTNDDFGDDGPGADTIRIIRFPDNGNVSVNNGGTGSDPTDDSIVYTSEGTFTGADTLIYLIEDGNGSFDTALVVLNVVDDDSDGDGVLNTIEFTDMTDPNDPCSLLLASVSQNAISTGDCDGDGVTNADEINGTDDDFSTTADNTDHNNPCDYNEPDQGMPSAAWASIDCDGDGNPNGGDNNPLVIIAMNDTANVDPGVLTTINILANDDFLGNFNPINVGTTQLTRLGGTAAGVVEFDADNGEMTYVSADGESGTTVAVIYEVCNTVSDPDVCASAVVTINVSAPVSATLNLKVMLQGALFDQSSSLMRDDLRSGNHLPLTEPYSALNNERFLHVGSGGAETTTQNILNVNANTVDAIVDWVFVELRDPLDSSIVVETRAALVQRDGDVVDPIDGTSSLTFVGFVDQQYYVAVKHRNHLGVMTASVITMEDTGTLIDFTTASSAELYEIDDIYDGAEQVTINGVQALWAGNTSAQGKVKYEGPGTSISTTLLDVIFFPGNDGQVYNFNSSLSYSLGDINMDGKSKYQGVQNDASYVFFNVVVAYPLNTLMLYNFDFMLEQLPGQDD